MLNGEEITVFYGKEIKFGTTLCLENKGLYAGSKRGNLFIEFEILMPKHINPDYVEKYLGHCENTEAKEAIKKALHSKHDGVKNCQLVYMNPESRTKNADDTAGQKEYGDDQDEQEGMNGGGV